MNAGNYVRTKDDLDIQLICKIEKIIDKYCVHTDKGYWDEKHIIKSSPNIIDLIEVGDYINGLRVEKNKYGELYTSYVYYGGDIGKQSEVYTTWLEEYKENEDYIESILTKEQFESMKYKVGE